MQSYLQKIQMLFLFSANSQWHTAMSLLAVKKLFFLYWSSSIIKPKFNSKGHFNRISTIQNSLHLLQKKMIFQIWIMAIKNKNNFICSEVFLLYLEKILLIVSVSNNNFLDLLLPHLLLKVSDFSICFRKSEIIKLNYDTIPISWYLCTSSSMKSTSDSSVKWVKIGCGTSWLPSASRFNTDGFSFWSLNNVPITTHLS